MENVVNKAIVIGVGIFVTIAITSGILLSINEMRNVYQNVYETDTNISNRFSEFDTYDNTTKTGLDYVNTLNKYKDDSNVKITYTGVSGTYYYKMIDSDWLIDTKNRVNDLYIWKFNTTVTFEGDDIVKINFAKK